MKMAVFQWKIPQWKINPARVLVILWLVVLVPGLAACSVLYQPKRVALAGNSLHINMDHVDASRVQSVYVVNFDSDRIYLRRNPAFVRCANVIGVKHGDAKTAYLEIPGARDYKVQNSLTSDILKTQAQVVFQVHDAAAGKYSTPKNNVRAFKRHSNFFVNSIRIELEPDELELLSNQGNQYAILQYCNTQVTACCCFNWNQETDF